MNYGKLSDFEINKMVGDIAMNGTWHVEPSHPENKTSGWLYGSNGINTSPLPDYCNNPADAWPIIRDSCIDIRWEGDSSEPQLRYAMIVYLMMQES